jgi:hypothetical protein
MTKREYGPSILYPTNQPASSQQEAVSSCLGYLFWGLLTLAGIVFLIVAVLP